MLTYSKARNDKRAILPIPMICSAAIIAAAAVSLPSRVTAAGHAPQNARSEPVADCTQEVWPYYSATCLHRADGGVRAVRVIPLDQVVKN